MRKLLWRAYQSDFMTESEKQQFEQTWYMPYKGFGYIRVGEGQAEKAERILEECVGEFEMSYYPLGFITDTERDVYYGKFEINDMREFVMALLENNIKIIEIKCYKDME